MKINAGIFLITALHACACDVSQQPTIDTFQDRSDLLIEHIAQYYPNDGGHRPPGYNGDLSDFGKYNYPKIIALYLSREPSDSLLAVMDERMEIYKDKPVFHFNLVGLVRLLYLFPDHPVVQKHELDFLTRVFERDDSYNPWTGEGTENHVNMSRLPGYLFAQLAVENYPGQFPEAEMRLEQMTDWVAATSKLVYTSGTSEWNSSTYGAYNVIGWLCLYDFAKDEKIKSMAKAVLDYYAVELALHTTQGLNGGPDMRGNKNVTSLSNATAYLTWLWFGDSAMDLSPANLNVNGQNEQIQAIHAATSSYRPPNTLKVLAQKDFTEAQSYTANHPAYQLKPSFFIKETFYAHPTFTLGAGYYPTGGWSSGNFQIVPWKLLSKVEDGDGKTVQFMGGIGMQSPASKYYAHGNQRSPFDQIVHHENVLIQMTRVPTRVKEIRDRIQAMYPTWQDNWKQYFMKRFPMDTFKVEEHIVRFQNLDITSNQSSLVLSDTGFFKQELSEKVLFVELESNYLAIKAIGGELHEFQDNKSTQMKFTTTDAAFDQLVGFVIEVGAKNAFESIVDFKNAIRQTSLTVSDKIVMYQSTSDRMIEAEYQTAGEISEPLFDWGYGFDQRYALQSDAPWQQPNWPSGEGYGRLAKWTVDGNVTTQDALLYFGPMLEVGNSKLIIKDLSGKTTYKVDYTGDYPVFYSE